MLLKNPKRRPLCSITFYADTIEVTRGCIIREVVKERTRNNMSDPAYRRVLSDRHTFVKVRGACSVYPVWLELVHQDRPVRKEDDLMLAALSELRELYEEVEWHTGEFEDEEKS